MSSPLPDNMALTTVRGRYGSWATVPGESDPQFTPYEGLYVRFSPAYPFVTNTTATPTPLVIATTPRQFVTDIEGYLSDPIDGFTSGVGNNRNCQIVSSDDPDIWPHDWKYLVTFTGVGATHFRAFRTPAPAGATVDMAVLTPQRVASGSTPSTAEIAAAQAAASAAEAAASLAAMNKGQAGGVAPLDADGDVNDADGDKILGGGGGGGGPTDLSVITGMSVNGKALVATLIGGVTSTPTLMRGVIGAGTSSLVVGTTSGTAADAALTTTALATKATDTAVVHLNGDENIDGTKTFLDPPVIPTGVSVDNPVTKAQLDAVQVLSTQISNSTTTGRAVIVATDAAAGRTALLAAPITDANLLGNPTAPTQAANNNSTRLANTAYVDTRVDTYVNAQTGSRFDLPCPGGVQPLRPTARTDIYFDWLMIAEPSQATGYALPGDGWRRESW